MLFVFNPKAGKGKIKTNLLDIIDIFNKKDYEVIIRALRKTERRLRKGKGICRSGGSDRLQRRRRNP